MADIKWQVGAADQPPLQAAAVGLHFGARSHAT